MNNTKKVEQIAQIENGKQMNLPMGKSVPASVRVDEDNNIIIHVYEEGKHAESSLKLVMSQGDNEGNTWDVYQSKNVLKLALTVKKEQVGGLRMWKTFMLIAARLFKQALVVINKLDNHD